MGKKCQIAYQTMPNSYKHAKQAKTGKFYFNKLANDAKIFG